MMSNNFRRFARVSIIALMVGIGPVASAMTQNAVQPAPVADPAASPAGTVLGQAAFTETRQAAAAAEAEARDNAALNAEAAALRPGQFAWHPERVATGPVEVVVSLAQQKAYVYRSAKLIAVTTVSTGRPGHRTPTGSFRILEKHRVHFSSLYNDAPMPNMQRLTMGGIALHAGELPGYAASHGCVRLPMEFSRLLFGVTSVGQRVHIIARAPAAATEALAFATGGGAMRMAAR
jgi:lipoprotein-anchoring transpeptidase ErfK/SrfK